MCTGIRFTDAAGNMFFGRNLDWTMDYGELVVVTPPKAVIPPAFARPNDPRVGRAVIGVGIVVGGVPLYFDCANDAGLAVAGLNFPQSAHYATAPVSGAENVAAYEFPYWIARNFSSLTEVRDALKTVNIVAKPVNDRLPVAKLHWLIGDATGSIVVECLDDGVKVWENDVDTLTNEPDFGWQRQNLRNYLPLSEDEPQPVSWGAATLAPFGTGAGMQGIPGDYSGPARFVKAAFVNGHYPVQSSEAANVARLFHTLGSVAVPLGSARMADGTYEQTLYTSGFSAGRLTYYCATYADPRIRAYPLSAYDLTGAVPFAAKAAA